MDQNVDKVAHAQQVPWKDPVDGLEYIENTIRWDFHKARLRKPYTWPLTQRHSLGSKGRGGDVC